MSKAAAQNKSPALLPVAPVLLVAVSAALSMLAVFQWMELRLLAAGGETVCGISESVNCATVWTSSFAKRIHAALGMPIAGLGLVYGLTALGLSLALIHRSLSAKAISPLVAAVRLTAVLGVLVCVMMISASIQMGSLCLTCLATYLLVGALAVIAFRLLPGDLKPADADVKPAVLWAGAFAIVAYLALLYPGLKTKAHADAPKLPSTTSHDGHDHGPDNARGSPLSKFLAGLQPMEAKALGDTLNAYRASTVPPGTAQFQPRYRRGPENAPIRIVDFIDIKCGHCRMLEETMTAISAAVGANSFSVEPRYFPLDSECNKDAKHTDGSGTRCAAAKALVCLEGNDYYWTARKALFDEQESLTKERALELASKGPLSRQQLEACIASPDTQKKLDDDVRYAMLYDIPGTPLVLINGRQAPPMGAFLYTMIVTGGNLSAPELRPLLEGR